MEFTTIVSIMDTDLASLWQFHLPVPSPIAAPFLEGNKDRRVICRVNDTIQWHAALMPKGDGHFYIMINKEVRKKLDLKSGDQVTVHLQKDESKYGMELPEEFEAILESDPEVDQYFHALTPGKQRSLLYLVVKIKSPQKRLQKALVIGEHLVKMEGKLDFKILNQDFKEANQQNRIDR